MKSNVVAILFLIEAALYQKTSGERSDSTSTIITPSDIEITQQTIILSTSLPEKSTPNDFKHVKDPPSTETTENRLNSGESPRRNEKATAELLSRSKDFNEDFIHFVLSAIRKSQTIKNSPSNDRNAANIIKKLISIIPRKGSGSSIRNIPPEFTRKAVTMNPKPNMNLHQLGYSTPKSKSYKEKRMKYRNYSEELPENEYYDSIAIKDNEHEFSEYESYLTKHHTSTEKTDVTVPFQNYLCKEPQSYPECKTKNRQSTSQNEGFVQMPPTRQVASTKYSFTSDVQDDINGNLHKRHETRDGNKVSGSYTYEDGFFRRTVHYIADEKGYRVIREEVEEIGDGPLYNPKGSAKFHAYIAGKNVDYQITTRDIMGVPEVNYQQNYNIGHDWSY